MLANHPFSLFSNFWLMRKGKFFIGSFISIFFLISFVSEARSYYRPQENVLHSVIHRCRAKRGYAYKRCLRRRRSRRAKHHRRKKRYLSYRYSRRSYIRRSRRYRLRQKYRSYRYFRGGCHSLLLRSVALSFIRRGRRLESAYRSYVRKLRNCHYLKPYDKVLLLVYDYRNCKLVAINQNTRASAASLIKPYVMLATYHKAHQRGISAYRFPRHLQRHVDLMIRVSNNRSTNYLIKHYLGRGSARRGLRYINRLLPRYSIRNTRLLELIPRGGRTYKNYTTARNLSMLLYRIYKGRAVSSAYSRKMLHVLLYSHDNRGKTGYLRSRYGIRAATKTGYTRRTNGVAGIILGGRGLRRTPYNFVAIITRPLLRHANEWIWRNHSSTIIRRFSEMAYKHYRLGFADAEVRRYGGHPARNYCKR